MSSCEFPPDYRPRVVLYVRSLCPDRTGYRLDEITDQLEAMDRAGEIERFSIEIWGDKIPSDTQTAVGTSLRGCIEMFERWCDSADTSISPFFESRPSGSVATDDTREMIVPPVVCLAEFHNETLQHVAPCVDDGTVCSVANRIETLEEVNRDVVGTGCDDD